MKKPYRVIFSCRQINAIGIVITKGWTVEANNPQEAEEKARQEASKTHEHLHLQRIVEMT